MVKIAPSILAADIEKLEEEIENVVSAGADYIHIDVMDGKFVNNITPGYEMYQRARNVSNQLLDTHLMVEHPEKWIEKFSESDIITFHIEAVDDEMAEKIINQLHLRNQKVGIAIKPNTPVEVVIPLLEKIDMVLVMTVEPGWGGQKMIEECLQKVKIIRSINDKIMIEVDGGINQDNIKKVKMAGANVIVAGTAIFHSEDREKLMKDWKKE